VQEKGEHENSYDKGVRKSDSGEHRSRGEEEKRLLARTDLPEKKRGVEIKRKKGKPLVGSRKEKAIFCSTKVRI